MKVSVLICTYNRPQLLAQCLDALIFRTSEKPDQIVVVNGGDGRADEVVNASRQGAEGTRQEISFKLIKTVNKNLAASRNVGLPLCQGDIVAMTDDDAEVYPDWVTQIKRVHAEHPEAGAVGGAVVGAQSGDDFLSRLADIVTFVSPPEPRSVRTVPGVNVSYKREVVEQVGRQDETLFRGEDVDYNWRVKQLGFDVYYHPAIRVVHHHRPTLRQFLRQHYMYGRAYYLVRGKWPDMYCVYPHALRRPKDVLKALNFIAAPFYEPVQYAAKLERLIDRVPAYPVLFANQLAWRGGMLRQKWLARAAEANQRMP
jgi:GT2 family glycosyltransferase